MDQEFSFEGQVLTDWLDYNGHMNVGYYGVAMDKVSDQYFEYLKIGEDYRHATNNSYFTVESHLTYQAEMLAHERYKAIAGLIDFDKKRLHFYTAIYKLDGTLSATAEWMHLHMDMDARRVAPFPESALDYFVQVQRYEAKREMPDEVAKVLGKSIGIPR